MVFGPTKVEDPGFQLPNEGLDTVDEVQKSGDDVKNSLRRIMGYKLTNLNW